MTSFYVGSKVLIKILPPSYDIIGPVIIIYLHVLPLQLCVQGSIYTTSKSIIILQ